MLLLIPTNDSISIASDFSRAFSLRRMIIMNGRIADDDLIRMEFINIDGFIRIIEKFENNMSQTPGNSDLSTKQEASSTNTRTLLVSGISDEFERNFQNHRISVFRTSEHFIINAVLEYMKYYASLESNYVCMP
jgi:hypothetical protein